MKRASFLPISCIAALTASFAVSGFSMSSDTTGKNITIVLGGITRMDSTQKEIYLVFTGHEYADGGDTIWKTLRKQKIKASFFFTGDFFRNSNFTSIIKNLKNDGHYVGMHSDKHLLYAPWEKRDSSLVTKDSFLTDVRANYASMQKFGISYSSAKYFLPPYEWYNQSISDWCGEIKLTLVNFTPGTSSNADYTTPDMSNYLSSDSIYQRILRYEGTHSSGLNGFILLTHIGTSPLRTDKFYWGLDDLIRKLKKRGYAFRRF